MDLSRLLATTLALAAGRAAVVSAQDFAVAWSTVDGGGTESAGGGPYVLAATIGQPDAGGPFPGGAFVLHSGFRSIAAGGGVTALADLTVGVSNGLDFVSPGQPVLYSIVVRNAGPSAVAGARVTDVPPAALTDVSWTCTASTGSSCPAAGGGFIDHLVDLARDGTLTYSLAATVAPGAAGVVSNAVMATPPDGVGDPVLANNAAADVDPVVPPPGTVARGALAHGARVRGDLAASGLPDVDRYRIGQDPLASYEVVLDEGSGDIGLDQGPSLLRVAADGATVLQSSIAAGAGAARSLRWVQGGTTAVEDQSILVRSASCTSGCGTDDTYRLRAYETTGAIPRFNNSATQVTIVVLQNAGAGGVDGHIAFWDTTGLLLLVHPFTLAANGSLALNTAALPELAGLGGSATVAHDGPYGTVLGKAVALEAATGFAFDSPLEPRRR